MKAEGLYYFLGIGCLTATFVFLMIGVYGSIAVVPDAGLAGGLCALAFLIPGLVFLLYWRQRGSLDRRLEELAEVLRGYRQLAIADLAAKIDSTPDDAELLVAACIGRGYIHGHIDSKEKTFIQETEGGHDEGQIG